MKELNSRRVKGRGYTWSERDVNQLMEYCGAGYTKTEVSDMLGRSVPSVQTKAKQLGLTFRVDACWPESDIKILRDMAESGSTALEIAKSLGRTCSSIESKAYSIGVPIRMSCDNNELVSKRRGTPWTLEEESLLRAKVSEKCSVEQLVDILGRSPCAIRNRMYRLGVGIQG